MNDDRIQNEIIHGKYLSELGEGTLWYWETPAGALRFKRRCNMLLAEINQGMEVLEIGCGPGYFTKIIAQTGANITAIDISPDLLDFAKKNIPFDNIEFKVDNAYKLDSQDNIFQYIIGSSILHHLEIDPALQEFFRVLKPGGKIRFTEPNMLNPHVYLERKIPFIKKMFHVSPDETAFIRWQIVKTLKAHGFTNINVYAFDFLHPLIPKILIPIMNPLGLILEKIPLLSEISGSMFIEAQKPQS